MKTFAAPLTTLALGLALGIGTVAVADDGQPAATRAQSDPAMLRELKNISKRLDLVNRNLGGYEYIPGKPAIQDLLEDIQRNTQP